MEQRNKSDFVRRPKYNSTYIKDLHRKVLFKDRIFLVDLTLKDDAKKTGGGHIPRPFVDGDDTHNLIPDMSIILNNKDLKIRFFDMIYRQLASEGIACLILRKLITSSNLTWKQLREYTNQICERFNPAIVSKSVNLSKFHDPTFTTEKNTCFKINHYLLKNLLNLIPFGFEPTTILDIAGTDATKALLASHFTKAKIDTFTVDKPTDTSKLKEYMNLYELVVCSHYLHHVSDKTEIADRISELIKPGGYLFVRDSDVESDDDKLLLDILHDFYDYVTLNSGVYKPQKLNYLTKESAAELFQKLEFQAESHVKYDITNPIKAFNTLFKKTK